MMWRKRGKYGFEKVETFPVTQSGDINRSNIHLCEQNIYEEEVR